MSFIERIGRLFGKEDPYDVIQIPVPYSFLDHGILKNAPPSVQARFRTWFFEVKSHRIGELEKEIRRSSDFAQWTADYSYRSIVDLDQWFATAVRTRSPTRAEKQWLTKNVPPSPSLNEMLTWRINEKTESICFDVAMYLGDSAIETNSNLRWEQITGQYYRSGNIGIFGNLRPGENRKPFKNFSMDPVMAVYVAAERIFDKSRVNPLKWFYDKMLDDFE